MKKITASIIIVALSSCSVPEAKNTAPSTAPQAAADPVVQPKPVVKAEPAPAFVQPRGDWIDWPITSGDWVYRQDARGSIALFGNPGQDALLTLRCDKNENRLYFSRAGNPASGAKMTLRTSHTLKSYAAAPTGASPAYAAIAINPSDAILDALVYTRGRFAVETDGMQSIAVPSWAEVVHVIEDCR